MDLEGMVKPFISLGTYELKYIFDHRNDIIKKVIKINNHLANEGESNEAI